MNQQPYRDRPTTEVGLQLSIEVGNEFFEPGLSRFVMNADGKVLATVVLEGKERRFEGQIDAGQAAKMIEQARAEGTLKNPDLGRRMGIPDEPRYHFEISQDGQDLLNQYIWRSELEKSPEVLVLLSQVQEITQRISDGSVIL